MRKITATSRHADRIDHTPAAPLPQTLVTVAIFRDAEWDEYRCRLYLGGTLIASADYHTDDLNDAKETARAMLAQPGHGLASDPAARAA